MPKIVLNERDKEARVPAGLLVVRAFVSPASATVRARAITSSGDAVPAPAVPPPQGTVVVGLADINGTMVGVDAVGVFPAGSSVTVVVEVGAYAVEIGPIAAAGLSSQDMALLTLDRGQVVVRVAAGDGDLFELSPLGEAARAATADLVGSVRVAVAERRTVALVVDGSASFRAISPRVVGRVLEVLSGVVAVTAHHRVHVAVSGPTVLEDTVDEVVDLPGAVGALLARSPRSSGSRLASAGVFRQHPAARTSAWVLTDDVPSDLEKIAAVADAVSANVNVVIVGDPSMAPPPERAGVPLTFLDSVALGLAEDVPRELRLSDAVRALLRGGSAYEPPADRKVTA